MVRPPRLTLPLLLALAVPALPAQSKAAADKPLPPLAELQRAAVDSVQRTEKDRERYVCRERFIGNDTDKKGNLKKSDTSEREVFFVKGTAISQTLTENGKPLSDKDAKKRDENVRKAIAEAESGKKKAGGNGATARDVLRMVKLTNERRVEVGGRPTIVFDVVPTEGGGSIQERFAHAVEGTVSIDEATGRLQDLNVRGTRDVKVGGGLLANVHKGFQFHVVNAPMNDGVWLTKLAEGRGDARVGLFLNRGGNFRQETVSCKLTDVQTTQSASKDGEVVK